MPSFLPSRGTVKKGLFASAAANATTSAVQQGTSRIGTPVASKISSTLSDAIATGVRVGTGVSTTAGLMHLSGKVQQEKVKAQGGNTADQTFAYGTGAFGGNYELYPTKK